MLTDLQIAAALLDQYRGYGSWRLQGYFFGVYLSIRDGNDHTLVALRGSTTLADWFRDLLAVHTLHNDPHLGPLHAGFAFGMESVASMILSEVNGPVVVAGHSLGGAEASILGGYMTLAGRPPSQIVTFGQPRPGFAKLGEVLKDVRQVSYRNGDDDHHDYITDVPYHIPFLFPYEHPAPMKKVNGGYGGSGKGVFDRHHMDLYVKGMQ